MWALTNKTAYAAERNWVRDKSGMHHWVVAVRATFDVSPEGRIQLADVQPPPALAPCYRGEPGLSSLRWDSDLLYVKTITDVVADITAHAPKGKQCRAVDVSIRVGPIRKKLLVHGPRTYSKYGGRVVPGPSQPFDVANIVYEAAYGGWDTTSEDSREHRMCMENPIGRGFALRSDALVGRPAPTIEYRGKGSDSVSPAGFGPVDTTWTPRRERAGTYDEAWARRKKPLLPDDYDDLYASCAPADQQVHTMLRGGEPVELLGLTDEGVLRFTLPSVRLDFSTRFGRKRVAHEGALATVLLLSDRRFSLIWQTSLSVASRDGDYLDETVISEKPNAS